MDLGGTGFCPAWGITGPSSLCVFIIVPEGMFLILFLDKVGFRKQE